MLSLAFLPIKAGNIVIMGVCHHTALESLKMQDQKSLTLCWRSFLGGGSNIVTGCCANKGGQCCDYGLLLPHSPVIIKEARPEIGDAALKFIFKMGQQLCRLPFYI